MFPVSHYTVYVFSEYIKFVESFIFFSSKYFKTNVWKVSKPVHVLNDYQMSS